ncbi:MAG TPA: InlB B-repeat-containing protein [Methanocorpusculum sp.]|nr:InlB B-repeat-containing protein [Methanocorpusculum sp.]
MMKTGCTGTESPKNGTGGLRRVVLALAVLLLTCVLMAGAVSADDGNVAKIGDTEYATLQWAVDNVTDGTETTIILLRNAEGNGVKVQSGKKIIFDLNNFTYNINGETVGSTGTETNGFQLLKDSEITFKNGKITSDKAIILIQNYANLTLENVILDGSLLTGTRSYTSSNNYGNIVYKGNTQIIADEGGVAFDVYYWPNNSYTEGVSVTIADPTVVIDGPVEFTCDKSVKAEDHAQKAALVIPQGYTLDFKTVCTEHFSNYGWEADGTGMKKLVPCNPVDPALPIQEPTKDEETGNTTISGTGITVEDQTATVTDENTGTTMTITFETEPVQNQNSVEGKVTEVNVAYTSATAAVPETAAVPVPGSVSFTLDLKLNNVTPTLPKINPSFSNEIAEKVTTAHSGFYPVAMITAETNVPEINNNISSNSGIKIVFTVPKAWVDSMGGANSGRIWSFHAHDEVVDLTPVSSDAIAENGAFFEITIYGDSFSTHGIAGKEASAPQPTYSSSSGNMNNAYRVLFNDGATTLSVVTDLSSGDKLTKPETPVKDGYTFAGWHKDAACTNPRDFETGIPGDMTLYAKWTAAGSSGETEATAAPTATSTAVTTPQPTKTQSTTATTSAPQATTAAGVSPTLTQAPAPVAGALFGLLAAGVLLRRRFQ